MNSFSYNMVWLLKVEVSREKNRCGLVLFITDIVYHPVQYQWNVSFFAGDICLNPLGMGVLKATIEKEIPEVYVKSLCFGNSPVQVSTVPQPRTPYKPKPPLEFRFILSPQLAHFIYF